MFSKLSTQAVARPEQVPVPLSVHVWLAGGPRGEQWGDVSQHSPLVSTRLLLPWHTVWKLTEDVSKRQVL